MSVQIRPNLVVILLDDVGFGASGTFGGPVSTPELDKLAATGLRYNRFHVTALCSPTRAALLSGRNDHEVGFGTVPELCPEQSHLLPGYNGIWPKNAACIADVLRCNGYRTAAFGKWHNTPYCEISPVGPFDRWPTGLGFEYFYGFMRGVENHWEPSALYRNTAPVEPCKTPEEGYHLTTDLIDDAIEWIHLHQSLAPERPFFLYFATGATHIPFQVPKKWIEGYRDQFDQGWDELRKQTFIRQRKLGVIPSNCALTPRPREIPAWDSLSVDKRRLSAREMEVYAAFLSHTDYEVGRLIEDIRRGPWGQNTVIMYIVGDNGAEGGLGTEDEWAEMESQARLKRLDEIGGTEVLAGYSASWAWAMDTPFQWMKQVASHLGGTRNPLVLSWPGRVRASGEVRSQYIHVTDIAPTLCEIAGIEFPGEIEGVKQVPLRGVSFAYTFEDPAARSRHRLQVFEQGGNRAIYLDGWLAAARHGVPWKFPDSRDFKEDKWELYYLDDDYSQAEDLATQYPDKMEELRARFDQEAHLSHIYPLQNFVHAPLLPPSRAALEFFSGMPRTPALIVPEFLQSSYAIYADVVVPKGGVEGMIVSYGSRFGGFAFYAKNNRLVYEAGSALSDGRRCLVNSAVDLPEGPVAVKLKFSRQDSATDESVSSGLTGDVKLYVNDTSVGAGSHVDMRWDSYFGTLGIGRIYASSVYSGSLYPFKFTGTLRKVRVEFRSLQAA